MITFETTQEMIDFINDQLDGCGLIVTDETLLANAIDAFAELLEN